MHSLFADHWPAVDALLDGVLATPTEQRTAFLRRALAENTVLGLQAEVLRQALAAAPGFLEDPEGNRFALLLEALDQHEAPLLGTRLGRYQLVRRLGEGGMGVVYLATDAEDATVPPVAIKVVRRSRAAVDLGAFFEQERQVLGQLKHPHIARLIDSGTTDDGHPFLVMEYIDGIPITTYGDAQQAAVDARLALFRTVCAAVEAAHAHHIIHRDLKPPNILVTKDGTPHLLDFGIATLNLPTQGLEPPLLTPAYASPEQLRGEVATPASDVYSLGVLLYELLTGRRPATPVLPPSTAVQVAHTTSAPTSQTLTPRAVAQRRGTTPRRLHVQLAGPLDAIVLRALAPDPTHRYPSAAALRDDLHRLQQGLPVRATTQGLQRSTAPEER